MNASITLSLALIAVALPFLLSIVVALRPSSKPRDIADYFLYQRSLSSQEFLRASMGYSLQAAAISLFLLWGITYGGSAVFVAIAWGLGYFAIVWALRCGRMDGFLGSGANKVATIHGFVAAQAKGGRLLVVVMAGSTVFGLGGSLIAEMDYGSFMVHSWLGTIGVPAVKPLTHLFILSFTCLYILWGGYRAAIDTDRIQVPLAYLGFGLVALGFYFALADTSGSMAAMLSACTAAVYAVLFLRRRALRTADPSHSNTKEMLIFGGLFGVATATALFSAARPSTTPFSLSVFFPSLKSFGGFGFLGVVALILTNGLWQFVDISSLQRLQSLDTTTADAKKKAALGLSIAGVEGAAGWILVLLVALGCRIAAIGNANALGPWIADHVGGPVLLPLLVFTVVIFAITTIDTFLSAISYVAYYDIVPAIVPNANNRVNGLRLPRIVTIAAIFVIYLVYMGVKQAAQGRIDAVLYGVYAVQIAIAPVVLLALFRQQWLRPAPAVASVLGGWAGALGTALTSTPPVGIPPESWYVVPPLAALLASSVVYLVTLPIAALFKKGRVAGGGAMQ